MAPKDVTSENEADIWAQLYLKRKQQNKSANLSKRGKRRRNIKFRFKINDLVRLSHLKHIFRRGYNQQFTGEIFKITKRFHLQGIPMYKVKDFNDETIEGDFYENDMQKVYKEEDSLWLVEKLIKKRKRKGQTEWLVKFQSWPDKFNQWVKESDIVDLRQK